MATPLGARREAFGGVPSRRATPGSPARHRRRFRGASEFGRPRPARVPLKPPLTRRWAPPKPPPPPGLGPSRRPPPHGPRVAITFAASPPPLPPPPSSPQPSAEAEAAPAVPAASLSRSRSRRRDPRGGACALRAAVGVGASRLGLGAGARRHVRLGGGGAGGPERAVPRRRQLSVTGCARSLPGGPVHGGRAVAGGPLCVEPVGC